MTRWFCTSYHYLTVKVQAAPACGKQGLTRTLTRIDRESLQKSVCVIVWVCLKATNLSE